MSDPFRQPDNAQLYREAQYGMAVLACLITLFAYLAVIRITGGYDVPQSVLDAPVAQSIHSPKRVAPAPSQIPSENRVSTSVALTDRQVVPANYHAEPETDAAPIPVLNREPSRNRNTSRNRNSKLKTSHGSDRARRIEAAANDLKNTIAALQNKRSKIRQLADGNKPPEENLVSSPTVVVRGSEPITFDNNSFAPLPIANRTASAIENLNSTGPSDAELASTNAAITSLTPEFPSPRRAPPQPYAAPLDQREFLPLPELNQRQRELSIRNDVPVETDVVNSNGLNQSAPSIQPSRPLQKEFDSVVQAPAKELSNQFQTQPVTFSNAPPTTNNPNAKTIVAEHGTSFYLLAQIHYDDARFFRALYQFNASTQTTDSIIPGSLIEIPTLDTLRSKYPKQCPPEESANVLRNGRSGLENSQEQRLYETRAGDTLLGIARDQLGQASRYLEILDMNRGWLGDDVVDVTRLESGIRLVLPLKSVQ